MNDQSFNAPTVVPRLYEIRVEGLLCGEWSEWFHGMQIAPQANGETILRGVIADQAALFGVLKKIRDAGMPLVSVNRAASDAPTARDTNQNEISEREK